MFSNITVVGAGQMGAGIAQVIAQKDISVWLIDIKESSLEKARNTIQKSLDKLHKKNILTLTPDQVSQKIQYGSHFNTMEKSKMVIEAVPENLELKLKVFKQISDKVTTDTIIASNTSSISINQLAEVVSHPERVAGLHFMNPVPLMKLVEIIRTEKTTESVFNTLCQFTVFLDKVAVSSKDKAGFIVNRILMPMINSAVFALMESLASAEDIDKAMQLGCHHKMGPLALADLIGLDICLSIMLVLQGAFGDKYAPCPLLKQYVEEGRLGKKSGRGFYTY
ncbi:MAG: 3-hydroxyacyl-CoA dehydrogenase NAD-binding domain-containing protein [Bdellovibrionales bacterium]|nr:3-hydroxyacyl-CoA dehydrogenase NAD-binding domain-containing protein [Bdellovibrionales bacterium]